MNNFKLLMNGIIKENPTFVLLLGMCPTLGTTSSAINGMGMGLATMFVLICSNVVISSIKRIVPDMVRIPVFIVVIASFVTVLRNADAGLCAGFVCHFGLVYPLDCSKLYPVRTCRSFCCQEFSIGFFLRRIGNGTWIYHCAYSIGRYP